MQIISSGIFLTRDYLVAAAVVTNVVAEREVNIQGQRRSFSLVTGTQLGEALIVSEVIAKLWSGRI